MDIISVAGLAISAFGLFKDLAQKHEDLDTWKEEDLPVDRYWLPTALEKGYLTGDTADYAWPLIVSAPTLEMKGTHEVVLAVNEKKKTKYRLVQGPPAGRLILMRKVRSKSNE